MVKVIFQKSFLDKIKSIGTRRTVSVFTVLFLVIGFGVTYYELQHPQDLRQRASTTLVNCYVEPFTITSDELQMLSLINSYRQGHGLRPLTMSSNLNMAAHWKATDMAVNNYFSHTDSLGRPSYTLITDCGYPVVARGENLAKFSTTSQPGPVMNSKEGWKNSPLHNDMLLSQTNGVYDPQYNWSKIGISRVYGSAAKAYYWVVELGFVDDGTDGSYIFNPIPTPALTPCVNTCATSTLPGSTCNYNSSGDSYCKSLPNGNVNAYCWNCTGETTTTPTPTSTTATTAPMPEPATTCNYTSTNNFSILAGTNKSISVSATNLKIGTTDLGFTSGTDKLFKNVGNVAIFNPTMSLAAPISFYTAVTTGASYTFRMDLSTTTLTPLGQYTLDAVYLYLNGIKTQCTYNGLGGLVINVITGGGGGGGVSTPTPTPTPTKLPTPTPTKAPTPTPTLVQSMCPGGTTNCANATPTNYYSCSGKPNYLGNTSYDNWCYTNYGGANAYCYSCVASTPTPTPTPAQVCTPNAFCGSVCGLPCYTSDLYCNSTGTACNVKVGNYYGNWCGCPAPTPTPTLAMTMCPGGTTNCANYIPSNYTSCTGTKNYLGNTNYNNWCLTYAGGANSYCYSCIAPTPTPVVTAPHLLSWTASCSNGSGTIAFNWTGTNPYGYTLQWGSPSLNYNYSVISYATSGRSYSGFSSNVQVEYQVWANNSSGIATTPSDNGSFIQTTPICAVSTPTPTPYTVSSCPSYDSTTGYNNICTTNPCIGGSTLYKSGTGNAACSAAYGSTYGTCCMVNQPNGCPGGSIYVCRQSSCSYGETNLSTGNAACASAYGWNTGYCCY